MKRILSLLLCIAFLKAQALAIHGPLKGSDAASTNVIGTYSGVLTPVGDDAGTDVLDFNTGAVTGTLNSMGLFSVAIPGSGVGSGSFVIFTAGISFAGTITAAGDPSAGTVAALLEATYDYVDFLRDDQGNILFGVDANGNVTPQSADYEASVRGTMTAEVTEFALNALNAAASNFGRLEGEAILTRLYVDPRARGSGQLVGDTIIRFTVDGVKQSLTADTATDLTGTTNTLGTGGLVLLL